MSSPRDAIIVGAGHNALVAAFYLARAGLKPLVLERRPVAGGAAVTDEFHPGFKCSILAHSAGPVLPAIARDMKLERHGLQMITSEPRVFAPSPKGRSLVLYGDPARSVQEIARLSSRDAQKYPEFVFTLDRLSTFMGTLLDATPPALGGLSAGDLIGLLSTGRGFRKLGRPDMFRILQWIPMPVADLVSDWFENELLRATIAARGVFGTFLGPRSPGSAAVLLLRAAAEPHPAGSGSYPKGGMGSLAQAMASAASEAGAEIRTGAEVNEILVKDGMATGVVLSSGEEIAGRIVVSGADPKRTLGGLVNPAHLDPGFLAKVRNYRCRGTTAKVNLALAGLPTFNAIAGAASSSGTGSTVAGFKGTQEFALPLAGRIHIGPDLDYLERAFDDAKYGRVSRQPYLDILIPSLLDPTLAPAGQHVMSIVAQFAPFKLSSSENEGTADWNSQRAALADVVIKTLSAYAPDLPGLILARQVITPLDLEQIYGLTGGHIFHGELALDQLFSMRPLLGWSRYRTPVRGLYLCGSGTHPGTGLTGGSGANAAREILKDRRRKRLTG